MSSRLNAKDLTTLARKCGLNEKAVFRLLRSVKVQFAAEQSDIEALMPYELGLHLEGAECFAVISESRRNQLLLDALLDYRRNCPAVTTWVGRGDFDPLKPSAEIQKSQFVHACRTAGRLRAATIKKARQP